ncbi:MAG: hypothetical protein N2Z40_00055, partial [Caldimicrobium sp.]|nr:hypothetical protein [Caldimicrobium sp.]
TIPLNNSSIGLVFKEDVEVKRFSEERDLGDDVRREAFFFGKGDLFFRDQRELRERSKWGRRSFGRNSWRKALRFSGSLRIALA